MITTNYKCQLQFLVKICQYSLTAPFQMNSFTLKLSLMEWSTHKYWYIFRNVNIILVRVYLMLTLLFSASILMDKNGDLVNKFLVMKFTLATFCIVLAVRLVDEKKNELVSLINFLIDYEKKYLKGKSSLVFRQLLFP